MLPLKDAGAPGKSPPIVSGLVSGVMVSAIGWVPTGAPSEKKRIVVPLKTMATWCHSFSGMAWPALRCVFQLLNAAPKYVVVAFMRYMKPFSLVTLFMMIGSNPEPTWLGPAIEIHAACVIAVVGEVKLAELGTWM